MKFVFSILLTLILSNVKAQCLCGYITINYTTIDTASYTINVNGVRKYGEKYSADKSRDDSLLKLKIETHGGFDTLYITIKNKTSNECMQLVCTELSYDIRYALELNKFVAGNYLFNWTKIANCISAKVVYNEIVKCGNTQFYNLNKREEGIMNYAIKPVELSMYNYIYK